MKITVLSSKVFYFDGKKYVSKGGFGKEMEELSKHFDNVTICSPIKKSSEAGYQIASEKFDYIHMPYYQTELDYIIKFPRILAKTIAITLKSEALHLRIPCYESVVAVLLNKILKKPIYTYIGTDWEEISYFWKFKRFKKLTKTYAKINHLLTQFVLKNSCSFIMGKPLYDKYKGKNVNLTANSTVSPQDIVKYKDTCSKSEIKLIYVGRLTAEKGLESLIDAVRILSKKFKIKLILVGEGKLNCDVPKNVEFKGYVPIGKKLNKVYQSADIFVFPSYETTIAKAVLEAMANGIPPIISNVGAMPNNLKHKENGFFIRPSNTKDIVIGVTELIKNNKLRRQIIKNNIQSVRDFTNEELIKQRMDIFKNNESKK